MRRCRRTSSCRSSSATRTTGTPPIWWASNSRIIWETRRSVFPILRQRVALPVRHDDLRQALGVHRLVFADDAVLEEQIGRERIHLVGLQRARSSDLAMTLLSFTHG